MNLFKKLFNKSVNLLPKIVISFESSGCQGEILKFIWIGYVTKEWQGGSKSSPVDYYEVKVLMKIETTKIIL